MYRYYKTNLKYEQMDDKGFIFAKIYYSTLEPLITSLRFSGPRFVRSLNLEVKNSLFPTARRRQITTCSRQVTCRRSSVLVNYIV